MLDPTDARAEDARAETQAQHGEGGEVDTANAETRKDGSLAYKITRICLVPQLPSYVEATCGASILEWVRQTYDGRMDFGATTTTVVEDLTGRKTLTLREWVVRYRDFCVGGWRASSRVLAKGIGTGNREGATTFSFVDSSQSSRIKKTRVRN